MPGVLAGFGEAVYLMVDKIDGCFWWVCALFCWFMRLLVQLGTAGRILLRLLSQDVAHQVRFAAVIHLGELLRDDLGNDAFFFHSVLSHPVTHSSTPLLPYTVIV